MSNSLVLRETSVECVANLVDLANFRKSSKKVISWNWGLALEIWKPEGLSFLALKSFNNFRSDVVVDDVFEINQVKIVGPWMENAKALVLNALSSILFNVFLDEFKSCFVGWNWICEIIRIDLFLGVANERSDSFYAGRGLQVLVLDLCI